MDYAKRHQRRIMIGAVVIAAIVVVAGTLKQLGYVLDGPYIVKGGTLIVEDVLPESDVFIDERKVATVDRGVTTTRVRGLAPGEHEILVARDDSWPWISTIEANVAEETTVQPLQIPKSTSGRVLTQDDELFERARAQLQDHHLPRTRENSTLHPRTEARAWADERRVLIQETATTATRTILDARFDIRSLAWYTPRTDVLLVAVSNGVFALDTRRPIVRKERTQAGDAIQNFQPIYKGVEPTFVVDEGNPRRLFIEDGEHTFTVSLEIK